jgi:hypothetical protein
MPVLADDDVVVHGDAERARDGDDRPGSSRCRRVRGVGSPLGWLCARIIVLFCFGTNSPALDGNVGLFWLRL